MRRILILLLLLFTFLVAGWCLPSQSTLQADDGGGSVDPWGAS